MAVQHANRGIVKKDLQLYYNREWAKSFRGEATSNLANNISIGPQGGSLTVATSYPSFSEDLSKGNYFKNAPQGGVLYHLVTNPALSNNGALYNNNGGLTGGTSIPISGTYLIFSFYVYLTQIYTGYTGGLGGYINVNTNGGGNGSLGSVLTSYGWSFYVNGVLENSWSSNTAYLNKWIRVVAVVNNGAISASAKYFTNWYIYADRLTGGSMYIAKFQIEQKSYVTNPVSYDVLTNLSNRGETTTNLIVNPDFTSTSNWNANGTVTLSVSTTGAKTYLNVVSGQNGSTPGILSDAIAVTAGNVYTLSAYAYRSGTEAYLYVYNVNNGTDIIWTSQNAAALGTTEGWCVNKFTVPAGCTSIKVGILFGNPSVGNTFSVEKMQLEQREYQSAFVNGSRTANTVAGGGGLLDISGNNLNSDLTNATFNSTGFVFSGSQYITVPYSSNLDRNDFTIVGYCRTSTNDNSHDTIVSRNSDVYGATNGWNISRLRNGLNLANCFRFMIYGDSSTAVEPQGPAIADNVWRYFAVVVDKSGSNTVTIYINGVAYSIPATLPVGNYYPTSGSPPLYIGCNKTNADLWNGDIAQILYYGKALTAAEVLQNFNATRKTYGI